MRMQDVVSIDVTKASYFSGLSEHVKKGVEDKGIIRYMRMLLGIYGDSMSRRSKWQLSDYLENAELSPHVKDYKLLAMNLGNSMLRLLKKHDENVVWNLYENGNLPAKDFPVKYLIDFGKGWTVHRVEELTAGEITEDPEKLHVKGMRKKKAARILEIANRL